VTATVITNIGELVTNDPEADDLLGHIRVLSADDHSGQPVNRAIRVAATHGFDKG